MTKTEEAAQNKTEPVIAGLGQLQQSVMYTAAVFSEVSRCDTLHPDLTLTPSSALTPTPTLATSHNQKSSNLRPSHNHDQPQISTQLKPQHLFQASSSYQL